MMEERMQIKCVNDEGRLHIQGVSNTVTDERSYGIAVKMRAPVDVTMWLGEQEPCLKSAASEGVMYIPFRIYRYTSKVCQVFIAGSASNHPNGAVMDVQPMSNQIKRLLTWADKAGLIEDIDGNPFSPSKGEEE
jgi:hypothetical protein|tara:strand:+ start:9609 stop:10010 length:402 start_codon:yes stop_codon:yes gene_type:complete